MGTGAAKPPLSPQLPAMRDRGETTFARRALLQGIGLLSGAAVAQVPITKAQAYDPGPERRARYRETEHVKAFYRTNGYETLKKK